MAKRVSAVQIVAVDMVGSDLMVRFSDQSTTLFRGHFLDEIRNHNGNVEIDENEDDFASGIEQSDIDV